MPDRTRARAVLAALLLAVAIVGIRAVGPAVRWVPPTSRAVVVVGATLEAVLAGLLVVVMWRRAVANKSSPMAAPLGPAAPADVAARLRAVLARALLACLIAVPVGVLLAVVTKPKIHPVRLHQLAPPSGGHHLRLGTAGPGASGSFSLAFVQYVLIALLVAAVVAVVVAAWLRRPPRLPKVEPMPDDLADAPAELARAIVSGRRALRELDDARAAIIGCYLAMELSLAEAGAARGVAETPDELLARVVALGLVSAVPAGRLTELFYEARFSSHPLPAAKRDQAERALDGLAAALPPQRPADGSRTSEAAR